ncbi:MAG: FluC/FEX family fluoride channel, partial [Phycisphaerales bacterium]
MLAVGPVVEVEALLAVPVVLGAASGALVRDVAVRRAREFARRADLGVLGANLAACAVAGLATALSAPWQALLAAGFAGGLSTWSGLAVEVAGAMRARQWGRVAL